MNPKDDWIGLSITCPGLHHEGCPDHASIQFAMGGPVGPHVGITLKALQDALTRDGWGIGMFKSEGPGGQAVTVMDPLCGDCKKRLVQTIVDETGGTLDAEALAYTRKTLGSEFSS